MKMEHSGIRNLLLLWFESYLSKIKQFVCVNGENSELRGLSCGVPQGSVLGPLLFLIYIIDLPNISNKLEFNLFADDTIIYYENESLVKLEKTVNKELKNLFLWLSVNRLELNIENFPSFQQTIVTIKIHKKAILEKNCNKYLGVIIDSTRSWKENLHSISNKLSRTIGIMYKLRPFINLQIMKNVYHALFYSHVVYGIRVWGTARDLHIKAIEILQKRVVRLITYNDQFPLIHGPLPASNPICSKLEILKIKDIFILKLCIFIHKCLNSSLLTRLA